MAGNMAWGLLVVAGFALLLAFGYLIANTIHEIPEIMAEWHERREFKAWLREHDSSRSYFLP